MKGLLCKKLKKCILKEYNKYLIEKCSEIALHIGSQSCKAYRYTYKTWPVVWHYSKVVNTEQLQICKIISYPYTDHTSA